MTPSTESHESMVIAMIQTCRVLAKDMAGDWPASSWIMTTLASIALVLFLMPLVTMLFVFLNGIYFIIYRCYYGTKYQVSPTYWDKGRLATMKFWNAYGRIWHGHEVEGLENIPKQGPGVIVYYHGGLPIDWYVTHTWIYLTLNRLVYSIGDRFVFNLPVFNVFIETLRIHLGSVGDCVRCLKDGELLAIAPGGMREAQFSDNNYKLLWGKRTGFAKVALEGKAPIIPVFTRNIREVFNPVKIGKSWFRKFYETTRIPIVPLYGNFPVKLKTVIGKPIPYDRNMTPEQLAEKTSLALKELIARHQPLPGSVSRALLERIPDFYKQKTT